MLKHKTVGLLLYNDGICCTNTVLLLDVLLPLSGRATAVEAQEDKVLKAKEEEEIDEEEEEEQKNQEDEKGAAVVEEEEEEEEKAHGAKLEGKSPEKFIGLTRGWTIVDLSAQNL